MTDHLLIAAAIVVILLQEWRWMREQARFAGERHRLETRLDRMLDRQCPGVTGSRPVLDTAGFGQNRGDDEWEAAIERFRQGKESEE